MDTWPNFFIVGAPKAGTTSLHEYLSIVPGIYMSPIKEPRYFSTLIDDPAVKPITDKNEYLKLFSNRKNEKIIGESSPTYLSNLESPKRIYEVVPNALILISLRDPVEKAYSAYFHAKRDRIIELSFSDVIDQVINNKKTRPRITRIISDGLYFEGLQRYLDIFGHRNVKIIFFEDLIGNTVKIMNDIVKFLGINYSFNNADFKIHNPYVVSKNKLISTTLQNHQTTKKIIQKSIPNPIRKKINQLIFVPESKPPMEENDKKKLIEYYKEDVIKLKNLLNLDLPWKNFKDLK